MVGEVVSAGVASATWQLLLKPPERGHRRWQAVRLLAPRLHCQAGKALPASVGQQAGAQISPSSGSRARTDRLRLGAERLRLRLRSFVLRRCFLLRRSSSSDLSS